MTGPYTFTGYATTGFPDYVDTATGRMLIAEPGAPYGIRAVNEGWPVPPADGRWSGGPAPAVSSGAPPGPPPPPPVPPAAGVPAPPEGGE